LGTDIVVFLADLLHSLGIMFFQSALKQVCVVANEEARARNAKKMEDSNLICNTPQ